MRHRERAHSDLPGRGAADRPAPGLSNFFAACAFTSGIAASGGAGKAVANWMMYGEPGLDPKQAFCCRSFAASASSPKVT